MVGDKKQRKHGMCLVGFFFIIETQGDVRFVFL